MTYHVGALWRVVCVLTLVSLLAGCAVGPFGQSQGAATSATSTAATPTAVAPVGTPAAPAASASASPAAIAAPATPTPAATSAAKVVAARIGDDAGDVGPSDPLRVTFSGPVDHAAVEGAMTLQPSVPGQASWSGDTLTYAPAKPWPDATLVSVHLAATTPPADGAPATQPFDWSFVTRPVFDAVEVSPRDGAADVPQNAVVNAVFSRPPDQASAEAAFSISPPVPGKLQWQGLTMTFVPAKPLPLNTAFTATLGPGVKSATGDPIPQPKTWRFTTTSQATTGGQTKPFVAPAGGRLVFAQVDGPLQLAFQGQGIPSIHLTLYRVPSPDAFVRAFAQKPGAPGAVDTSGFAKVTSWDAPLTGDEPHVVGVPGADAPGIYFVDESAAGPDLHGQFLVVSARGVLVKQTPDSMLAWVTSLADGKPVAGVPVQVFDAESGAPLLSATSDANGVAEGQVAPKPSTEPGQPPRPPALLVLAGSGDGPTVGGTGDPFFLDGFTFTPGAYRAYAYTDRPIYRPGDTVHLRAIVRADDDAHYKLPGAAPTHLVVDGPGGQPIFEASPKLDEQGAFALDVPLAADLDTGFYQAALTVGQGQDALVAPTFAGFQVAAHRTPQFAVTVRTRPGPFVSGDHVAVTVAAAYYSGQPVAGGSVALSVKRAPTYEPFAPGGTQQDPEQQEAPQFERSACCIDVLARTATLDASGAATLDVPADLGSEPQSQEYTFEATVKDPSNAPVTGRASATIHRGALALFAQPERFVTTPQAPLQTVLTVQDLQQQPRPGVIVPCQVFEQTYSYTQEGTAKGAYPVAHLVEVPAYTVAATTGSDGKAAATLSLFRPASYHVSCNVKDDRGNTVTRDVYLQSVSDTGAIQPYALDQNQLTVKADRQVYAVGDTAHLQIVSAVKDVPALVTVERGRIYDRRTVAISGSTATLDVPVTDDDVPNVQVSVSVQGRGRALWGQAPLRVPATRRYLTVSLATDKDSYRPGDKATVTLKAADASGAPVQGAFSLAAVDEAVFALASSIPATIKWGFYGPGPVPVATGASLQATAMRLGGGGRGGGGGGQADLSRTDFRDTAYWSPSVQTGADGTATAQVTLPDSLTTWRFTAIGATADTQVGYANDTVVSTLPFQVRPLLPRFLTAGDRVRLGALVVNETDSAADATVTLEAGNVSLAGDGAQRVSVPARGSAPVYWTGTVGSGPSSAIDLRAQAGPLADSVGISLPISTGGSPGSVAKAGAVQGGETSEDFALPPRALPGSAALDLAITPTLASGAQRGLAFLAGYPYDCAEQTLSGFLPAILAKEAYAKAGIPSARQGLPPDLDARVAAAVQRLSALQHPDGGWNWWSYDQTDPYMTAYVVYGLAQAKRLGYPVVDPVVQRGVASLQAQLSSPAAGLATRAYMLWVLASTGHPDAAKARALAPQGGQMAFYGQAYLAQALQLDGDAQAAKSLLAQLGGDATQTDTAAVWHEKLAPADLPPLRGSDVYSTAAALDAYAAIAPGDPVAVKAARSLLASRLGDGWETTHDSAMAIMALDHFLLAHGDLAANQHYQVFWNGTLLKDVQVSPGADSSAPLTIHLGAADIRPSNSLKVASGGASPLFWSAALRYRVAASQPETRPNLGVSRAYTTTSGSSLSGPIPAGQLVRVRLSVQSATPLDYVLLTDQLPSGLEPFDPSLATGQALQATEDQRNQVPSRVSLRDTGADVYVTKLPAGSHTFTYYAQAVTPGTFQAPPATVSQMYQPSVTASSPGATVTVAP